VRITGCFFDEADDGAVALVGVNEGDVLFLVERFEDTVGGIDFG